MFAHLALGILLSAAPRAPVDLTTIDRSIRVEPAYAGTPAYCLFAFGPEAKLRVWVVLEGNNVYVDRNGNGDITEPGERFTKASTSISLGDVVEPDTKRVHRNWRINLYG